MDEEYSDIQQLLWDDVPMDIRFLEADMFTDLSKNLYPGHPKWSIFCEYLNACVPYFSQDAARSGFFEVRKELRALGRIETGSYGNLKHCLKTMPDLKKIVEKYENNIKDKWRNLRGKPRAETERSNEIHQSISDKANGNDEDNTGDIAINVYERSVCSIEGQPAVLRCSVDPQASSIVWKKGKPEPDERVFIDKQKYYGGNHLTPPLVIMNTDKSSDESSYCLIATGNDKRTKKRSGIIHLYVDTVMLDHTQVSSIPKTSFLKRRISEDTTCIESEPDEPPPRSPRIDSDANVTFTIENNIDTTRQESKEDIRKSLETYTQERGRINSPEFLEQCILVTVDITGASSPTEPSALCLAERIESFLREGDIRLTDDANTKLKIKTEDIKNQTTDGFPIVSISQAEYFADERTVVVIHCTVLACPPATSVRWVRIRYGEEEELDIDNDKYLGGVVLSPSLVITDVSYTDEGYYRCYVTSNEGEGKSNTTWLETNSDYTDLSTFLHQNGHEKVDSSAVRCIKTYLESNRTSGDDVPLLRIAIDNSSRDLLRYIISTEPEVLSSCNVDGCDALHYCCQYGTLPLFNAYRKRHGGEEYNI